MIEEPNVTVITDPAEAERRRRKACSDFLRQLEGTGLTMTVDACVRWYGVDPL